MILSTMVSCAHLKVRTLLEESECLDDSTGLTTEEPFDDGQPHPMFVFSLLWSNISGSVLNENFLVCFKEPLMKGNQLAWS